MADDPEEVADISAGCNGCVINMGNTGGFLEESMLRMGRKNNELDHPVIFDPAGLPEMIVSGGRLGEQIILKPEDLCKVTGGKFADIIRD